MSIFGWSLPPGCGTLPGEEDEQMDNRHLAQAFPDADGPGELYRQLYKYTDCGPSLSVTFKYYDDPMHSEMCAVLKTKTVHCDGLNALGTWADMDKKGELIIAFLVGSIVEGVDYDCETIEVTWDQEEDEPETIHERLYAAVTAINDEANSIWYDTHGCERCHAHWIAENIDARTIDLYVPVWSECPDCGGNGVVI